MAVRATEDLLADWSRRYRDVLLKFFQRRTPASVDREDLVQEVFLHMARRRNLGEVREVERFLFRSAANVLKDWKRKQLSHASDRHDPIDEELRDVGRAPEHVLSSKQVLEKLVEALELLPERTRTIFVLYHFEQLPHAQIARDLGIAVRTVEDHVARANAKLLDVLKDVW
jgi:RNA polymerase sigma factor (sigma-70 family)